MHVVFGDRHRAGPAAGVFPGSRLGTPRSPSARRDLRLYDTGTEPSMRALLDKRVLAAVAVMTATAVFLILHGSASRSHWEQRKQASEARILFASNARVAAMLPWHSNVKRWMNHAIIESETIAPIDRRSVHICLWIWMTAPDALNSIHTRSILALLAGIAVIRSLLPWLWYRWWLIRTGLTRSRVRAVWLRELEGTLGVRANRSLLWGSASAAVVVWYVQAVRPTETGSLWLDRWLTLGPGAVMLAAVWLSAWMSADVCRTLSAAAKSEGARTIPVRDRECVRCSYPLAGLNSPRCPECGLASGPLNPVQDVLKRVRITTLIILVSVVSIGCVVFVCAAYVHDRDVSSQAYVALDQLRGWTQWAQFAAP